MAKILDKDQREILALEELCPKCLERWATEYVLNEFRCQPCLYEDDKDDADYLGITVEEMLNG